jgi:hypothetical protein
VLVRQEIAVKIAVEDVLTAAIDSQNVRHWLPILDTVLL